MAWEKRECGSSYYTRSRKVNGRVVREYVGGGIVGETAAQIDAEERRRREEEKARWLEERKHLQSLDSLMEEIYEGTELLVRAALVAAGYHQHKRGEWRKKRGNQNPKD